MSTTAEIREHIAGRLAGKTVEPFPSPHLIVSDFFPAAVYAKILEYNLFRANRGREWISSDEMKKRRQSTPYDRRKQIDLDKGEFAADGDAKTFWKMLADAMLGDDWFAKLVYRTYPQYFELRFGEAILEPDFWSQLRHTMFVQRHEAGYHIGPHTDTPHRVFTCIFAFADAPGYEQFGTQFVRPRDRLARCWGDLHHEHRDFEVATVAKYQPNNFVVFFKTRQSFHAVTRIADELPNQRYGMQLAYYEPHQGMFHELSRPELMEDRTAKPLLKVRAFGRTLQITRS
jgi:hypothetical protein